jgi:glycosyltransferase involved in cell wall biosynthesis
VFTIVSTNYIAYAATLMQSLAEHVPDAARFIILSDTPRDFTDTNLSATLLGCEQLGIANLDNMKIWYSVIEFNTAIKPYAFIFMFEQRGFDEACYIDPDILLFSGMDEVFDALQDHSCVLTPHMLSPLQDGKEPSDLTIMKSGVYNLGFLGLKNDEDGLGLAKWWADRCFLNCRVDIAGNMFTDQRWMDLAPVFVRRPFILRHPGYNVAYWNLLHRIVTKDRDGTWIVNGERLVFFHFSGISPDDRAQFSKHQNRFSPDNMGEVNELCDLYRLRVLANHWRQYAKVAYGFGSLPGGRRINDIMRHWVVRAVDEGRLNPKDELSFPADFFDAPEEAVAEKGVRLTRFMYQFWLDRRDLSAAFDIFTEAGLRGYFDWFLGGDAAAQGVDASSLLAAGMLRNHGALPGPAVLPLLLPPWPRVSLDVWVERSTEALADLAADLVLDVAGTFIRLPKQAGLLWERRRDLQSAFDVNVPEGLYGYLCWTLTNGIPEGAIDLDSFSEEFICNFRQVSVISNLYADMPITEGMISVRHVRSGRDALPGWQRFPVERSGRLAHGLWFAFVAPELFGWPKTFVAPVCEYFWEVTPVRTDGFSLNRAILALWEMRADLQRAFPLGDRISVWRYLRWLVVDGLRELKLSIQDLDPRLPAFLRSESPRFEGMSQILEMVHDSRADLREHFDLNTSAGREGMKAWAEAHLRAEILSLPLGQALFKADDSGPDPPVRPVHYARVALSGYWRAPSGRGEDIRGSARSLDEVGFDDYVVVDLETRTVLLPDGSTLPGGYDVEAETNIVHTNADTTVDDARYLRRLGIHAARAIGFWAWELEWLPDYWRHAYSFYDEIWASTEFAEQAFQRDGLRPVTKVPMAVIEPEIDDNLTRADLGLPETATLFLFMFDFRSYAARKNPQAVVRAFLQAFPDGNEDVHLLIKTSGADAMPADARALRELANDHRIELRDERLERSFLLNIIRSADAFVSLHRSEGFGRGPAEAMLLGVPTIVTDYSGSSDYATPANALLVDYQLTTVMECDYPGVTGQKWAEANVATAARHMRWVNRNRAKARALGQRGRKQIQRMYNTQIVGEAMLCALGLHANPVAVTETAELVDMLCDGSVR